MELKVVEVVRAAVKEAKVVALVVARDQAMREAGHRLLQIPVVENVPTILHKSNSLLDSVFQEGVSCIITRLEVEITLPGWGHTDRGNIFTYRNFIW